MDRRRWRPSNFARPDAPLRVVNAVEGGGEETAAIYLYDAIDDWGGEWGVSASEFVAALSAIRASRLQLRLNSPGGSFFEAVAMRAALVAHPATVDVYVDGLAASAASLLATVGDRVVMAPGSQMMIHNASTFAWGNADGLRGEADLLDRIDADIANFYVGKAGGQAKSWRVRMRDETWYNAAEAVAAGLADEVAAAPTAAPAPGEDEPTVPDPTAPDEGDGQKDLTSQLASAAREAAARWTYPDRAAAPDPEIPAAAAAAAVPPEDDEFDLDQIRDAIRKVAAR